MVLMAGSISATAPPTIQSPVSAQTTRKAIEKCISPNVSVFFMAFTSSGPNNNDSRLWLPMKRFISGLSFPLSLFVIVFVAGKWARALHCAPHGRGGPKHNFLGGNHGELPRSRGRSCATSARDAAPRYQDTRIRRSHLLAGSRHLAGHCPRAAPAAVGHGHGYHCSRYEPATVACGDAGAESDGPAIEIAKAALRCRRLETRHAAPCEGTQHALQDLSRRPAAGHLHRLAPRGPLPLVAVEAR